MLNRCAAPLVWILALLVFAPASSVAMEPLECEWSAVELDALDTEELLELTEEPGCAHLLDRALEIAMQQIALQLAGPPSPPADETGDQDPRSGLSEQARLLNLMQIRRALDAGNRVQALQRVERLLWELPESAAARQDDIDEADQEELLELREELISIRDILLGQAPPAGLPQVLQAKADWRPTLSFCGTPAAMLDWGLRRMPTPMAAWRAVGQPRQALDRLIDRHWIDALSLGMAPSMLREYAEASFGPGSYARELERGLSLLRIEQDLDGWRAWLPMFGRELPVPLGYQQYLPEPDDGDSRAAEPASTLNEGPQRERLLDSLGRILRPHPR